VREIHCFGYFGYLDFGLYMSLTSILSLVSHIYKNIKTKLDPNP